MKTILSWTLHLVGGLAMGALIALVGLGYARLLDLPI